MTQEEYDKAKEECWKAVKKELDLHYWGGPTLDIVSHTFDRAFALGKQETNSSQKGNTSNYSCNHFADVRKMVDTRLHIATNVLGDIIKSQYYSLSADCREENISEMAKVSVQIADALIAECEKGGNDE